MCTPVKSLIFAWIIYQIHKSEPYMKFHLNSTANGKNAEISINSKIIYLKQNWLICLFDILSWL